MPCSNNTMHNQRPYLIIGDIHHHTSLAETIARRYEATHTILFVGDYFDDFFDDANKSIETAQWLIASFQKPNRIHLLGNHDLHYSPLGALTLRPWEYRKPARLYLCSGYEQSKDKAINSVLSPADWDQLKLHHLAHGWHVTHAGLHPHWFQESSLEETQKGILSKIQKAEEASCKQEFHPLLGAAGMCRGGDCPAGGIMWHDHLREATPMPGIRQVYGHTPTREGILRLEENRGVNICVDCQQLELLEILPNGETRILDTYGS